MRIVNIIVTIILAVTIPVSIICLANNLTVSMPDLYQYELKSTEILNELTVDQSEDEMAQIFSDFMTGETKKFQIQYQFGENTDNLFTYDEQKTMDKFRDLNSKVFLIGINALILSLLGGFFLYKQNLKPLIRHTFIRAAIVFGIMSCAVLLAAFVTPLMGLYYDYLFEYEIKSFMVLPNLITKAFFLHSALATVVISSIAMILVWYFVWKITKPRRIFGALR